LQTSGNSHFLKCVSKNVEGARSLHSHRFGNTDKRVLDNQSNYKTTISKNLIRFCAYKNGAIIIFFGFPAETAASGDQIWLQSERMCAWKKRTQTTVGVKTICVTFPPNRWNLSNGAFALELASWATESHSSCQKSGLIEAASEMERPARHSNRFFLQNMYSKCCEGFFYKKWIITLSFNE
jgi:hypothetical protein